MATGGCIHSYTVLHNRPGAPGCSSSPKLPAPTTLRYWPGQHRRTTHHPSHTPVCVHTAIQRLSICVTEHNSSLAFKYRHRRMTHPALRSAAAGAAAAGSASGGGGGGGDATSPEPATNTNTPPDGISLKTPTATPTPASTPTATSATPTATGNDLADDLDLSDLSDLDQEVQRQKELLRQYLSGKPPQDEIQLSVEGGDTQGGAGGQQQAQGGEGGNLTLAWYMRPWLTWAMCTCVWVVLVQQWWPLVGLLVTPLGDVWETLVVVGGVALLVPSTPVAMSMQMDLMSWTSGSWPWAAVRAACMFSGVIPTLVFTRGLLDAGRVIETAYGPLVMATHVVMAAWGAAVGQLLLGMSPFTISGPAVVCGLYAGRALLLMREQRVLKQQREQAQQGLNQSTSSLDDIADASLFSRRRGASVKKAFRRARRASKAGLNGRGGGEAAVQGLNEEEVEALLSVKVVDRTVLMAWAAALVLGLFQPMLGVGGVIGGLMGGAAAGLVSTPLIRAMRWLAVRSLALLFDVLTFVLRLPMRVLGFFVGLVAVVAAGVKDAAQGLRRP